MIGWQFAPALWALPLASLPVLIHLLRMHRAERRPFPSLRFVRASQTASVRVQAPSDLVLLLLRTAAIALAVVAAAGPVLVTPGRVEGWNARTARAVVVDASDSMKADGGTHAQLADEAARAELAASTYSQRIESRNLGDGVARARAWLETTPPSRREIVVISDFQRGALTRNQAEVAAVPEAIGLRFVPVGAPVAEREVPGAPVLAYPPATRAQTIGLTADATSVSIAAAVAGAAGVRLEPELASERLLRIAAAAGTTAGDVRRPLAIRFVDGNRAQMAPLTRVSQGWMLDTAIRLQRDLDVAAAADATPAVGSARSTSTAPDQPWLVVARDRAGAPLIVAAASGDEMILDVAASSDTFLAAAVVRGALTARQSTQDYAELEVARVEPSTLAAWGRQAGPATVPPGGIWRGLDPTDARWCWVAVLILLGLEQWLRGRRPDRSESGLEAPRAAA